MNTRSATSSVLATLSPSNIVGNLLSTDNPMPLQHSVRNSSPRTLNAASMIAAALRPAQPQTLPTLPNPSPTVCQGRSNYYWSQDCHSVENSANEHQVEDTAWPLESFFDDIF